MCKQALNNSNKAKVIEGTIVERDFCQNTNGTLIPWSIFIDTNSLVIEIKNDHSAPRGYSKFFNIIVLGFYK